MNRKNVSKRVLLLIVAALSVVPCTVRGSEEPVLAPENPAFVDYILDPYSLIEAESVGTFPAGLIPEPLNLTALNDQVVFTAEATTLPPAYFDLRTQNKLTPIRNQGSCGSCWSFATYGSLESFLMPGESCDFSENNLKNLHGFDIASCSGGNRTMSAAYLARWSGPVSEADDPYGSTSRTGLTPQKHVQDIIYLPNRASVMDNDTIKQAVMDYGAVYTTYYHNNTYYKSSTAAYYYNGTSQANHAVAIVGWDDSYSATNFNTPPPGNGAFIIRNSWGTYWGKAGYFYLSYYDSRLGKTENAVFTAEPATNYDTIYQYDPLGWIANTGYGGNTAWFANVFTATSGSNIAAASWYTAALNSTYELYIYLNPTNGPMNTSGPAAQVSGTMTWAGYHTVKLSTSVPVSAGQRFSVVVKMSTPGYGYPIPLERPYSGYASAATASAGQSYISSSGTSWSDVTSSYPNSNVCLKAFASNSSTPIPQAGKLSISPSTALTASGNEGGPFSPVSQAYTLTNSGGSAIAWKAANTKSWTSLSATSGMLAAGATTTVTVSINAAANTLLAGTYSDTVTFTNTTNGDGNAMRSINLTVNNASPTPGPGSLTVSPSTGLSATGTAGGPFTPSSQIFTLTNTGQSALSWTASRNQSWTSLSATSSTLAAGASTTVTVSINSAANSLAAGSYADTVAFKNTTNDNGSTSRTINLSISAGTGTPGSYSVQPTTFSWIDPSLHTKLAMWDDSVTYGQYMPFSFTFYGKSYNRVFVGSNGLIGFSSSGIYLNNNTDIPNRNWPNCAIYPYWDNLNPGNGGNVTIGTVGSMPNRQFVISWVNVPYYGSSTARFSFQAILCEGTNDIIFQYKEVSSTASIGAGRSATIGVEDETGYKACKYSYNGSKLLTNGMALRISTSGILQAFPRVRRMAR